MTFAVGLNAEHYGQHDCDRVAVRIGGPRYSERYDRFADLELVLARTDGANEISWPEKSMKHGHSWLGYSRNHSNLESLKPEPESTREWMLIGF